MEIKFDWNKLKMLRKFAWLSLRDLEKETKINKNTIWKLENWEIHNPQNPTLKKLATYFKVEIKEFYVIKED